MSKSERVESEAGSVWPPPPNRSPVLVSPKAKRGTSYLSLAGLMVGVCANVFVFCWCVHVSNRYPVYPGPNVESTVFNPVLAAALTAALVGLPLSIAGKARGHRASSWIGVGFNVLSLFSAYFWSGLTAVSWE